MELAKACRAWTAAITGAGLVATLGMTAAFGPSRAQAAAELPEWTNGVECVVCHTAEAASVGGEVAEKPAGAKDGETAEKPAAEVANGSAAGTGSGTAKKGTGGKTARDGGVASGSVTDSTGGQDAASAGDAGAEGVSAAPLMALHGPLACDDCHFDADGKDDLEYAHWGVDVDSKPPTELKYSTVDPAVCLACHEADYVPEATDDVDTLTDTAGVTANPHDLYDPEGAHASVTCIDCHTVHVGTDPGESGYKRCIDCHHVEVWGCACHDE